MFLLYNVAKCSYWFSSACNYCVGGVVSYFLNKYYTFQNKERSLKQFVLFFINLLFCYCLSYVAAKKIIYFVLVSQSETTKGNIALVLGMCLYTTVNYFIQRYIVFKEKS